MSCHVSLFRQSSNIVKLLDVRWDRPCDGSTQYGPTLYLEYANLGTLYQFCASDHPLARERRTERTILLDVCQGLEACHISGITHGDVKPSNILVFLDNDRINAKISDFGCAILTSQSSDPKTILRGFSPPWDAPEAGTAISSEHLYKTDIYSYGLLYYWYRTDCQGLFGLESTEANAFDLVRDRSSRLDTLKTLKRSKDLRPLIIAAIMSKASGNHETLSLKEEASMILNATVTRDFSVRNLESVRQCLKRYGNSIQLYIYLLAIRALRMPLDTSSENRSFAASLNRYLYQKIY